MQAKAKYAVSGALAGAVNGLFGGGGGMVLVPLLSGWCGMEGKRSFATCVAVILPLSAVWRAVWWAGGCSAASAWSGCGVCSPPFWCTAA